MGVGALTTSHAAAAALLVDVRKPDGVRTAHVQSFARTVRCENRGNSERVIIQEAVGRFAASAALAVCCSVTWPSTAAHPLSFTIHQARVLASVPTPPRNQWMHLSDATALPAECTTSPPLVSLSQRPDSGEVTNQSIVAEAWLVVNEKFLDARHHRWSEDTWLKKREEVLKRSAPSRMAAYNIIRNMLSDLNDPYTRFITPSELQQLSKYDMTGIGLSLGETGTRDNTTSLRVIGVVLGSPAQLAGVNQGDELLSVNGVDVYGKSAFEASSLIQGAKGTLVSIEVRHEPCKDTQQFLIERQQSVQTPVYYRLEHRAGDAIGYIRVKELNAVAKRDMVTAMNKLTEAGATSFLLDLRDNPGGLVQAGIEIAKVFLNEGDTVVYTVGKDSETHKRIFAKNPPLTEAPLMVLVNERTASASEIVAAALHDNCRAVLIGHRTFGKGLIQSVFELSDGSGVILTAGKYVTPRHQDIDGNGISPDFQNLPGLANVKQKLQTCSHPD